MSDIADKARQVIELEKEIEELSARSQTAWREITALQARLRVLEREVSDLNIDSNQAREELVRAKAALKAALA
jgi:chromosome segregation ATPase